MIILRRLSFLILFIATWSALTPPPVWAAGVVGSGSPTSCNDNKLAAALKNGGLVTFNCGKNPLVIAATTHLIQNDTTIFGDNKITLDGENLRQLFIVDNDVTLTLKDILLTNGQFTAGGCASVDIRGTLQTEHVTFQGCRDTSAHLGGGAVYNLGNFNAIDTTFESNEANNEGGAVFNRGIFTATKVLFEANKAGENAGAINNVSDGTVIVNDSSFVGNSTQGSGGAISNNLFVGSKGSLTVQRTLFVDNSADVNGGAINNVQGSATFENCTFVRSTAHQGGAIFSENTATTSIRFSTLDDNRADTGAGIYRPLNGSVQLGFTIITGGRNEADISDNLQCDGPAFNSTGYNLISDDTCVDGTNSTDLRNTSPKLGTLKDNGGFSATELPNLGSPALAKVPHSLCVARDQRFAKRNGKCDIGAAELGGLFESAYMPRLSK